MRKNALLLLGISSRAIAGEWKIQKRDILITETVFETVTVCPCTTTIALVSSSSTNSSQIFVPTSASIGDPILTPASAVSSISTIPASFLSSSTAASSSVVASSSISVAAPGSTVFVSAASLGDYRTTVLSSHNIHRVNHTVPDLTWSDTMAQYAAQIASTCVYAHSK